MSSDSLSLAAFFPVFLAWAAAADISTRSIPNEISVLMSVTFVLFAAATGLSLATVMVHVFCALIILAGGFVLFSFTIIGSGDAKLLAAAALWFGFQGLQPLIASTAIAGGVLAFSYLAYAVIREGLGFRSRGPETIPYGVAIAVGALYALPDWLGAV